MSCLAFHVILTISTFRQFLPHYLSPVPWCFSCVAFLKDSEMTSANPTSSFQSSVLLPSIFSLIWGCASHFMYQLQWEACSRSRLLTCRDNRFHLKISMSLAGTIRANVLSWKKGRLKGCEDSSPIKKTQSKRENIGPSLCTLCI